MLPAVEAAGGEIVGCHVLVDRSGGLATLTSPATGRVYPLAALWTLEVPTFEPGPATCPRCADGTAAPRARQHRRDGRRVIGGAAASRCLLAAILVVGGGLRDAVVAGHLAVAHDPRVGRRAVLGGPGLAGRRDRHERRSARAAVARRPPAVGAPASLREARQEPRTPTASPSRPPVVGFTLQTTGGDTLTFMIGELDNVDEFPPDSLYDRMRTEDPIRVFFTVDGDTLIVYHIEDAG